MRSSGLISSLILRTTGELVYIYLISAEDRMLSDNWVPLSVLIHPKR